jgi:hypothetical protein
VRQRLHMNAAKRTRLLPAEKSAQKGRRKQNPRAAERKKGRAQRPDPSKQNPRAAVPNFKENPRRQRNLLLKRQVLVRERMKAIKGDLTGNQKDTKRILRPRTTDPENSANGSSFSLNFTSS